MMKEKELKYVLKYYQDGALDTQRALRQMKRTVNYHGKSSRWRWAGIAASLLILIGGAMTWHHLYEETVYTAEAQIMKVMLADGTEVTLSPHSSLSYHGDDCRTVTIKGKAYLDIKHDERHPFQVKDAHYVIHDIGTKFTIEETKTSTTVHLTEGSVYFAAPQQGAKGITMTAGQSATMVYGDKSPHIMTQPQLNADAWATGLFHFDCTPLHTVLSQLSEYYNVNLTANDTTKRLTGDFDAHEMNEVIDIIEHTLNVKITHP